MTNPRDHHTILSFDTELGLLRSDLALLADKAQRQLAAALAALAGGDGDAAAEVIAGDAELDVLERKINDQTVRVLALRNPVATDLRLVLASLKIAGELERIGDLASNIGKRTLVLHQLRSTAPLAGVLRLGQLVTERLRRAVEAHFSENAEAAHEVWSGDQEVDQLHTSLFREILTYMMEDPRVITTCIHLIFIAKNIERIGDHATNMAEMTHFLVLGRAPSEQRPKGDLSAMGGGVEEMPEA